MTEEIRARIEACHTDDGIDHGRHHIEECFWAIIEKYEDGYIYCPITWSGGTCEECMEILRGGWREKIEYQSNRRQHRKPDCQKPHDTA